MLDVDLAPEADAGETSSEAGSGGRFTFTLRVEGGSTVRRVVADANCSASRNCADPDISSTCTGTALSNLDPLTATDIGSQPYNGQFVGLLVQGVTLAE